MRNLIIIALLYFLSPAAVACTTFCINKNGHIVFGRNYDWITGAGTVNTNQRGLFKTSAKNNDGQTISWVSKYGSITFNQYGKEFPTGGMNEKGVVVELMWLDGTLYPAADARPSIGVLQWIQYQLDNAATVKEILATDSLLRITNTGTPLHYLVADANGQVATIEFLKGKTVVHTGKQLPFPVLTNSIYRKSVSEVGNGLKRNRVPEGNSLERFSNACRMITHLQEMKGEMPVIDYAFTILNDVGQGDYTKWSIVYDISNKKILFKTNTFKDIKTIAFSGFDFSCNNTSRMLDMNQPGKGDVTSKFTMPDALLKQTIIEQAIEESKQYVSITKNEKEMLLNYENSIRCK